VGENKHAMSLQYGTGNEVSLALTQGKETCGRDVHSFARMRRETRRREITHVKPLKQSYDMCCLFSLCHPFTAVVSGKDVMDDTFDRQLKGED